MRFEPRRVFTRSVAFQAIRHASVTASAASFEIAFLEDMGIGREMVRTACIRAEREGVCVARGLLAYGDVSECRFYRSLAYRLGLAFDAGWPSLARPIDPASIQASGLARLEGRAHWLIAPTGEVLRILIAAHQRSLLDRSRFTVTTPAHLAAIVRHREQAAVIEAASLLLPVTAPGLSAKGAFDWRAKALTIVAGALVLGALCRAPTAVCDAMGLIFFIAMIFRLIVCAFGYADEHKEPSTLDDDGAPFYSVLVPLYREAHMVEGLVAALDGLDYPKSKLEVLILIEIDDIATRDVLFRLRLPPYFQIIVVPDGRPRTKPRALNAGLFLARGSLLAVYDAEDRPAADQLRRAAACFAEASDDLGCLQAVLTVGHGASILARLFSIEYAALFQLFNVGISRLRLPMALGGTSNHFRVDVLRGVGGWDAWNVTEDADLGLRLARFGYRTDTLASATREQALDHFGLWFKQRRRWMKGWLQTTLVLTRGGRESLADLGPWHAVSVALMLINLVIGPLLTPIFIGLVIGNLVFFGLPSPRRPMEILESTISFSVIALGISSTLWSGFEGLRRSKRMDCLLCLPLLLPYQLMISLAAWGGLIDLFLDPYHWHKTEHTREPDGS